MSSSLGDDGRYLFQGVHDRETVQRVLTTTPISTGDPRTGG
jgi:hypothetical protein